MSDEPLVVHDPRDWSEDFPYENGNYQNRCVECKEIFIGHKRRVVCKKCQSEYEEKLAQRTHRELDANHYATVIFMADCMARLSGRLTVT